MKVYRITRDIYSQQLTASGISNRWNLSGQFVIYAGSSRALASLEMVVHKNAIFSGVNYKVLIINLPDQAHFFNSVSIEELGVDWRTLAAYPRLQKIGARWYDEQRTLCLKIPSAVIPQEYNYAVNTRHPDFNRHVSIQQTEDFFWDKRLI